MEPNTNTGIVRLRQDQIIRCHLVSQPILLRPFAAGLQRKGEPKPMGTERQVMQEYLDALVKRADFPSYFTEDVVATFEGTDQLAEGRDAAGQLIRYVHENAFDARAEVKNLLADDGKAAIEADFVGTHIGEFAGIQPTGRTVRVPYSVVYDLRGDQISALRIYFPMSLLMEQLTN
jgi:predicted ester cyclase